MEQHRIAGDPQGEPLTAGAAGARIRIALDSPPSPRWSRAFASHLATELVGSPGVSRLRLDRVSRRPGIASILVPNQGAVMLWETVRSMATTLSTAFAQSFRRLKAHNRHPIPEDGLPSIDGKKIDTSLTDLLTVTVPKKPFAHKPEKKIELNAAA